MSSRLGAIAYARQGICCGKAVGWMTLTCLFAFGITGCKKQTQSVVSPESAGGTIRPYDGAMEADDGQWVRSTKDYANTRYSSLDQINTGNVGNLRVAWTFDTGV